MGILTPISQLITIGFAEPTTGLSFCCVFRYVLAVEYERQLLFRHEQSSILVVMLFPEKMA